MQIVPGLRLAPVRPKDHSHSEPVPTTGVSELTDFWGVRSTRNRLPATPIVLRGQMLCNERPVEVSQSAVTRSSLLPLPPICAARPLAQTRLPWTSGCRKRTLSRYPHKSRPRGRLILTERWHAGTWPVNSALGNPLHETWIQETPKVHQRQSVSLQLTTGPRSTFLSSSLKVPAVTSCIPFFLVPVWVVRSLPTFSLEVTQGKGV